MVSYRYRLTRDLCALLSRPTTSPFDGWIESGSVTFVMLNPSTADDVRDDPTIRRCARFAWRWGYSYMHVVNLFAARATNPDELLHMEDPVGPGNDESIVEYCRRSKLVVVAWGARGGLRGRDRIVAKMLADVPLWCLGRTKHGYPRHPLYVRADVDLTRWEMPGP